MGKQTDITKDYSSYRTLSPLTMEIIAEYESFMQPDPVHGVDVYKTLEISAQEAIMGTEKELDVTVSGEEKRILVKVPAGIENGKYIRYREKGEPGQFGGQNGNLYVRIVVKKEKAVTDVSKSDQENLSKQETQNGPTSENTFPINITFLEACNGAEKEVILPEKTICKKCRGTGKIKEAFCSNCGGSGKIGVPQKVLVKIPAGIDEGQMLHLKRNASVNKLSQDWYVKVAIDKHPKFERKGYDIYSTEILPFYIGSGRNVAVDTLDGKQYCNITKEIKEGSQTCLKGKGIGRLNHPSSRGDHYITWKKK